MYAFLFLSVIQIDSHVKTSTVYEQIVEKSAGKAIDSHCVSTPEICLEGREILLVTL